ncbi:hypothetical protein Tco_0144609 [Tanacetum coccineum]
MFRGRVCLLAGSGGGYLIVGARWCTSSFWSSSVCLGLERLYLTWTRLKLYSFSWVELGVPALEACRECETDPRQEGSEGLLDWDFICWGFSRDCPFLNFYQGSYVEAWVPTGPARQEGGAGGVAKEAPVTLRGGDEDEEMPHTVPPPPRTQGERISRLEFSTWTVTSLIRLMDRAGVPYTRYSESPIEYQRRTRQRTGEPSTSTAQQQPDP